MPLPRADYGLLPLYERVIVLGRKVGSNPDRSGDEPSGPVEQGPSPTLVAVVSSSGALAWRTQVPARVRSDYQEAVVRDDVLYLAGAQTPGRTALALGLGDGSPKKGPAGYVVPTLDGELVTQQTPGAMLRRGDENMPGTSVRLPRSYTDRDAVPLLLGQDDESSSTAQDPATKPWAFNAVDSQEPSSTLWSSKGVPLASCGSRLVSFQRGRQGDEGVLVALDSKDGSSAWTRSSATLRALCSGPRLVVMEAYLMTALSADTGKEEWTLKTPGGPCAEDPRREPDLLFCGSADGSSSGSSADDIAVTAFAPAPKG